MILEDRINPLMDGLRHINIYSRGRTALGRDLSNFAPIGFEHPTEGTFASIEGYWYWLGTQADELRYLTGYAAKQRGRELLAAGRLEVDGFQEKILKAIELKITQNNHLWEAFVASKLPFSHYYFYGKPQNPKVHEPIEFAWLVDGITKYRRKLKTGF